MRWVFWILGLFALAVAVALALRFNTGYALLVWPPYRAELSLNLLVLLLAAGFVLGYLLFRFIFGAIGLPAKVREYRERRRRDSARATLLAAVNAFFAGRFGRAEKAAAEAMESADTSALGAVLAARAAHELRRYDERDAYLTRAEEIASGEPVVRIIAAADMLLDQRALEECWHKIPAEQKRDAKIAAAAAQCYMALGGIAQALQIIEQALAAEWDSELVGIYAECEGVDTIRQIERAEQWLKANPRDAVLLLTLGRLCARQELWGKAQSYLDASISVEPLYSAYLALAELHDRLGNADAARRNYRESLDLAVNQLKQMTGGRRRTAL